MRNSIKYVFLALFASIFAFSSANVYTRSTSAENANITINNAAISKATGDIENANLSFSENTITSAATYHKQGDSITYQLEFKNGDADDYKLVNVNSDSLSEYLAISYTDGVIEHGNTKTYDLTISYNELIEDISERALTTTTDITFTFERLETPNSINPKTSDSIIFYAIAMIASLAGLSILAITNKTKQSHKVIALAALYSITAFVGLSYAATNVEVIVSFDLDYSLASKLQLDYMVDDQQKTGIIDYGAELSLPAPSKTGYDFTGWLDEEGTIFEGPIIRDMKLTANFNAKKYTVIYDYQTNGGDSVDISSEQVEYRGEIDLSPIAYKQNWTFVGWNTDKNSHEALSSLSLDEAEDITLYAIYKRVVSAYFFTNNNEIWHPDISLLLVISGSIQRQCEVYNLEKCSVIAPSIARTAELRALGYSTSPNDYENIVATSGEEIKINDTAKFYAQTMLPSVTRTASWDGNGNELSFTEDSSCTIPEVHNNPQMTRSCEVDAPTITAQAGHEIVGFNIDKTESKNSSSYKDGKLTLGPSNTGNTWYAITIDKAITITYNANDGWFGNDHSKKTNIVKYYNGKAVEGEYADPTYTAKAFDKWYTSQGTEFDVNDYTGPQEITVYASYNSLRANIDLRSIYRFMHDGFNSEGTRYKYLITAFKRENYYPDWANNKDWSKNLGTNGNQRWVTGTKATGDYGLPLIVWLTTDDYVVHWYSEDNHPFATTYIAGGSSQIGFAEYRSLTDISGIADWDVSGLTQFEKLFWGCTSLTDLSPIAEWDMANAESLKQSFGYMTSLSDASAINSWNINKVNDFTEMFTHTSARPTFATRNGSWSSNGTFIPE